MTMDLEQFIRDQREFSTEVFGPGDRTEGVCQHIEKELAELRAVGGRDVFEWCDVVILALDGAWRAGFDPKQIAWALQQKLAKNKSRTWPDWRTAGPGPIEHDRTKD
jgi:hypothetical protein